MPKKEPILSQVVPVLVAVLVCDVAVTDPNTGKKNLIGIFDNIHVTKFPTKRPIYLYLKLVDAEGDYKIEVRYVQVDSNAILAKVEGAINATDRLKSTDMVIPFPPLPIPKEGKYEFQIWANSIFLGQAFINATPRNT